MSRIQLLKNVVDGLHSLADDIQAIADALAGDETAAAEEAAPPAPEKPQLTLEEVRAVLAEKSHDGFTKEIRELLEKYGALTNTRFSPLPPLTGGQNAPLPHGWSRNLPTERPRRQRKAQRHTPSVNISSDVF